MRRRRAARTRSGARGSTRRTRRPPTSWTRRSPTPRPRRSPTPPTRPPRRTPRTPRPRSVLGALPSPLLPRLDAILYRHRYLLSQVIVPGAVKADQILDFKKSSTQIGEAMQHRRSDNDDLSTEGECRILLPTYVLVIVVLRVGSVEQYCRVPRGE